MVRGLIFRIWQEEGLCYLCSANISAEVTAKLICVFVFAYVKSTFSHNEAQIQVCAFVACIYMYLEQVFLR